MHVHVVLGSFYCEHIPLHKETNYIKDVEQKDN
jgi:hypothetical protein